MKKVLMIIIAVAVIAIFLVIHRIQNPVIAAPYTVAILQTASHPALDASREGFIEELKSKMGDDVAFVIQNAEGSIAHVHSIAQQFHVKKQYSAFFAIATPAAQAMHSIEKERPICIAAVSDPDALGLVYPNTNVCGTKDKIDVKAGIDLLVALVPSAQRVGVLYTSGEVNSVILAEHMRHELAKRGLVALDFAMSSEADMQAMVESACHKVDAILAPTDNMVGAAISSIASITLKHQKPLIVSDNMLVKDGPLAAQGVDYKAGGRRSAQILYEILVEDVSPSEMPIEQIAGDQIFVNKNTLEALGLSIPNELTDRVVLVS